jgi:hypothetical protein
VTLQVQSYPPQLDCLLGELVVMGHPTSARAARATRQPVPGCSM